MWGQDHQWLDVEFLQLGLEAGEAETSPSTGVTLQPEAGRHQKESSVAAGRKKGRESVPFVRGGN